MNIAIVKKETGSIKYFILDCIKTGNNYSGSNIKLAGMKPIHWDFIWTNDILKFDEETQAWDKTVEEINICPVFKGEFVGSIKDVNDIVKKEIRKVYPLETEFKILRTKFAGFESDFEVYNNFIEKIRKDASKFKKEHFK